MKIAESTVREFVSLHNQGVPYREIGRRFEVDWRTVKARIEKVQSAADGKRFDVAFHDVYAGLLRDHLSLLVQVAFGVLRVVETQPLFTRPDEDPELLLDRLMEVYLDEAIQTLRPRGIDLETSPSTSLPDTVGDPAKKRMIRGLLRALDDHEPELRAAVDDWIKSWKEFQRQRREFGDRASRILTNAISLDPGLALSIGRGLAEGVLQADLLGQKIHTPVIEEGTSDGSSMVLQVDVRKVQLGVGSREGLENALLATRQTVLPQIRHLERLLPVKRPYAQVCEKIVAVQDLVDAIVLRGFPRGSCSLCAFDSGGDS